VREKQAAEVLLLTQLARANFFLRSSSCLAVFASAGFCSVLLCTHPSSLLGPTYSFSPLSTQYVGRCAAKAVQPAFRGRNF
jgi:hypothetical protein